MVEEGALSSSAVGADVLEDVQGIDMMEEGSILKSRGKGPMASEVSAGSFREGSKLP
jgi:hypothetical protein